MVVYDGIIVDLILRHVKSENDKDEVRSCATNSSNS